jgi:hypothetical protein
MAGPIDRVFARFDSDQSGYLELGEVVSALQELVGNKLQVDEELLHTVMEIVDKDTDGRINIDEYLHQRTSGVLKIFSVKIVKSAVLSSRHRPMTAVQCFQSGLEVRLVQISSTARKTFALLA